MDKQEANEHVVNSNDCVQARGDGANTRFVYPQGNPQENSSKTESHSYFDDQNKSPEAPKDYNLLEAPEAYDLLEEHMEDSDWLEA